jgi:hypothetical protein
MQIKQCLYHLTNILTLNSLITETTLINTVRLVPDILWPLLTFKNQALLMLHSWNMNIYQSRDRIVGADLHTAFHGASDAVFHRRTGFPLIFHLVYSDLQGSYRKDLFLDNCQFKVLKEDHTPLTESGFSLDQVFKALSLFKSHSFLIDDFLALIAAMLHLGNIEILPTHSDLDGWLISNQESFCWASRLLGIAESDLIAILTTRSLRYGHTAFEKTLEEDSKYSSVLGFIEANLSTRHLIASIYDALLCWTFRQLNSQMSCEGSVDRWINITCGLSKPDPQTHTSDYNLYISDLHCTNGLFCELIKSKYPISILN